MTKQKDRLWDWEKILQNGDFQKTDKVLETGALFGEFAVTLSPLVESVIVTDSYDWAKRSFVHEGDQDLVEIWEHSISTKPNLTIEKVDMQNLKYKNASFDKVVCISSIEHVPNDRQAIKEMMRVLKPDGSLLLTTEFNDSSPRKVDDPDGSFYRIYDNKQIEEMTAGFRIVKREVATETPVNYTTIFLVIKHA